MNIIFKSILFIFLISFTACSTKPHSINTKNKYSGKGNYLIYVVNHGWHTGIAIPAKSIYHILPELKNRFGDVYYIEFGWGDKGFYQANEITTKLTLNAIFLPTESVVHAVGVNSNLEKYFYNSEIEVLFLNKNEVDTLAQFISNSFARDKHNSIIPTRKGIYGDSQFYEGIGDYYLMNTCNKWTAKALKSIGMDISTTFKLTSSSIMSYLKKRNSDYSK